MTEFEGIYFSVSTVDLSYLHLYEPNNYPELESAAFLPLQASELSNFKTPQQKCGKISGLNL